MFETLGLEMLIEMLRADILYEIVFLAQSKQLNHTHVINNIYF